MNTCHGPLADNFATKDDDPGTIFTIPQVRLDLKTPSPHGGQNRCMRSQADEEEEEGVTFLFCEKISPQKNVPLAACSSCSCESDNGGDGDAIYSAYYSRVFVHNLPLFLTSSPLGNSAS